MKIEYLFMSCVMSIIKDDTHFNNIYSYIQNYSNYLKAGR